MSLKKLSTGILFLAVMMNSCTTKKNADVIVTNATVYLVDEAFSKTESFAVVEGKIAATGTTEEILTKYSSENIIDSSMP